MGVLSHTCTVDTGLIAHEPITWLAFVMATALCVHTVSIDFIMVWDKGREGG